MNSVYDVQQLLKQFGTYIYTGNRQADLELMQDELMELQSHKVIQQADYLQSMLILRKEINRIKQMES